MAEIRAEPSSQNCVAPARDNSFTEMHCANRPLRVPMEGSIQISELNKMTLI